MWVSVSVGTGVSGVSVGACECGQVCIWETE